MDIREIDHRVEAGETITIPGAMFGQFHRQMESHIRETRRWHITIESDRFTIRRADIVDPAPDPR